MRKYAQQLGEANFVGFFFLQCGRAHGVGRDVVYVCIDCVEKIEKKESGKSD